MSKNNSPLSWVFGLLAVIGLVIVVLAVKDRSFAKAGDRIDGVVSAVTSKFKKPEGKVEQAADKAGQVVKAGARKVDEAFDSHKDKR
jgi:hypothetical protein